MIDDDVDDYRRVLKEQEREIREEMKPLAGELRRLKAALKGLGPAKRGRPEGTHVPTEQTIQTNLATLHAWGLLTEWEIGQKEKGLSPQISGSKKTDFIEEGCKLYPKANAETVRAKFDRDRRFGSNRKSTRGSIRRRLTVNDL